jgi:hypothetical protein
MAQKLTNRCHRPNTYIDATRGSSIPQEFIACQAVPVVKKEKAFQGTFAETLCYNMMLSEVVLPLMASMYVLELPLLRKESLSYAY